MDLNRLTQKSQEALHDAQTKALRFGHTEVAGCARTWRPSWAAGLAFPVRVRRPVRYSSPSGSPA